MIIQIVKYLPENISRSKAKNGLMLFFFIFSFQTIHSQSIEDKRLKRFSRQVVEDMSSDYMHGRGYVKSGDKIAAGYLDREFKSQNLKSFRTTYYQGFNFPVNIFPGEMKVKIDGKELIVGKDYIVGGSSGSLSGDFTIVHFNANVLSKKKLQSKFRKIDFSDKVIVVDTEGLDMEDEHVQLWIDDLKNNVFNAKAIVVVKEKLTAEMSQKAKEYATIKLLKSAFSGTEETISIQVENKFIKSQSSQNVIGYIKGSVYPDSFIVFSAHYDHLGHMGADVYFPGANDNASGCAMLLSLAKYYTLPVNKPKYSIAFMGFGAEEVGLVGSEYYTKFPYFPLANIKFLLNMDILGTGDEGIMVVNGSVYEKEFNKLQIINFKNEFVEEVKSRRKAAISDHHFFTESDAPSFFIYTMGGIKAYHDIYDKSETLPMNEFVNVFKLITSFTNELQN